METQTVEIAPNTLYRPDQIEAKLGKRCLRTLRHSGLRAIGGWYLGKTVLDSFECAWQAKKCQRVPEEKEVNDERKHAKKRVDKASKRRGLQPVSKPHQDESLSSQIERIEKARQKAV